MAASRVFGVPGYIPPMPEAVTLQAPELPLYVAHQPPATLGQVPERDLTPQVLTRRPPAAERTAVSHPSWIPVHGQVMVLTGFLGGEEAGKNSGVAFGGHAAVVVASDVAGHAVQQQALSPVSKTHRSLLPRPAGRQLSPVRGLALAKPSPRDMRKDQPLRPATRTKLLTRCRRA